MPGKKPSRVLSLDEIGYENRDECIKIMSVEAPERRERTCEILEGSDDKTMQEFIARIRERL